MLKEFTKVRQDRGWAGWRRLFQDETFELFVWYNPDGSVHGFQLCYHERNVQRALTWKLNTGYWHDTVDDEKRTTPLLTPDGRFPKEKIMPLLESSIRSLEHPLKLLVLKQVASATV